MPHGLRNLLATILLAAVSHGASGECVLEKYAELPVTMDGTRPMISGTINGKDALFLADSGAYFSVLKRESAESYNLKLESVPVGFGMRGVGGEEDSRLTRVKQFSLVGLGNRPYNNVEFLVGGNAFTGREAGVIGQNVLGFADAEYDLANGVIRLMHPKDCGERALAYWAGTAPVGEVDVNRVTRETPTLMGSAKLNGLKIRVLFDTGAYHSVLSLQAATRAGFSKNAPEVQYVGPTGGFGPHQIETWIARFDSLDLNGEQIRHAKLQVGDMELNDFDLLLGADFFLSHRVYVSSRQHKIYFTYNGGRVFDLSSDATAVAIQHDSAAGASDATPSTAATLDADALRRRGAASAGRLDFVHAIADLDLAIKQNPTDAENYLQRAMARLHSGQPVLAMEDLDQTLKLKPEHIEALLQRGGLRLKNDNEEGARSDFNAIEKLLPNNAGLALAIAEIYDAADRSSEALSRFNRWLTTWPSDNRRPTVLNERCWLRAMSGKDLDLALTDCNGALRLDSANAGFLDSRALVFLRRGELDRSIADYHAALKRQPKAAGSLFGLGIAEKRKGLQEQGEKDMKSALALDSKVDEPFKKMGLISGS